MRISRRNWLAFATASASAPFALLSRVLAQDAAAPLERRIATVIGEYEAQGFHRTGTAVDRASGDWLAEQVRQAGLVPTQESFPLGRIDLVENALIAGGRRIEGVPLFDGSLTGEGGIRGRLGGLDTDADIGVGDTAVNAAGAGALGGARRSGRHRAIVAVTRGRRPGLCPSNAESFLRPFGPPVLQVSSDEATWLGEQITRGIEVQLIAHATRTAAAANNVTAAIPGVEPGLPPFVIMTPRSGWYRCASERGGGIACWLETMRALSSMRLKRPVLFVASSGHELGHLGINAYIERRPGIAANAVGWLHLGANIGAATEPGNLIQAPDDELDAILTRAMAASGLKVDRRTPRGNVPTGEAEAVHRGGGRYVSIVGSNGLFHNPDDRGPQAVDAATIARFCAACITVARTIAGTA